jgi:hypothetical protein
VRTFIDLNFNQALDKDTATTVTVLEEARSRTLASYSASQYGVHFASSSLTLFKGSTFSSTDPNNEVIPLNPVSVITSLYSFSDGGTDIVFTRLIGEAVQSGTFTLSSTRASTTKTVTIYKTGIVQSN